MNAEQLRGLTLEQMAQLPGATVTNGVVYIPPTPEETAAYMDKCMTMHGGTYWMRELERRGVITKEQADLGVFQLRLRRRFFKSQTRRKT